MLKDLTTKDIYNILILNRQILLKFKEYWPQKLGVENIRWDTWFQINNINKLTPHKTKDFNWRILHGLINTEKKLKTMNMSDGLCLVCNGVEDIKHLLYGCDGTKDLWSYTETILSTWLNEPFRIRDVEALSGSWNFDFKEINNKTLLTNTVLSICRHHIWRTRCKLKYGNAQKNSSASLRMLKWLLRDHLNTLIQSNTNSASDICEELLESMDRIDQLLFTRF